MKHVFQNPGLLDEALTHTSWAYENGGPHNERLEFLGDAVLQLCCTEILYARFPNEREGVLHTYRTQLVSTGHLAQVARKWGIPEKAKLGKGEEATGGRDKDRLLAGLFEAILGAIYLDGGFSSAQAVVVDALHPDIERLPTLSDPRGTLHEWCQREHGAPPAYEVSEEEGPPHDRIFTIQVRIDDQVLGEGRGRSKRAASIEAATEAVKRIGSTQ